ncbi:MULTISPECIES: hypothetical protein [unclassified Methylophaga]|uniref:hypothetical protein n=1 Tax=unclassified Methylophaga TaxID=2629249 RepID=UPI000C926F09|nr:MULTISPECIES: hypothetical protein [unclassified Methylophaga]MBN46171.1 hypothetical protein [Methylophaga sp.]|tara:strand:+ start:41128 stop:41436 length:309 start_codon:yes stop_codon:yes gene_type:complete
MYTNNYLRNRGIFILIILAVALLSAWLIRPHPELETFYVDGTVVEITEGQLTTMLVEIENGDKTRLLVSQKVPDLDSPIRLIGKRYADGNVRYQIPANEELE